MKINGNDIIVFVRAAGAWKALAYGLNCEIDIAAETIRVRNPLTGRWMSTKKKRLGWTGSSSHLLSDEIGEVDAKRLVQQEEPVRILIGSVEAHKEKMDAGMYVPDGRFHFAGDALVTRCTVTANKGTKSTMSMEFVGTGEPDWHDYYDVIMQGELLLQDKEKRNYNVTQQ